MLQQALQQYSIIERLLQKDPQARNFIFTAVNELPEDEILPFMIEYADWLRVNGDNNRVEERAPLYAFYEVDYVLTSFGSSPKAETWKRVLQPVREEVFSEGAEWHPLSGIVGSIIEAER